MSLIIGQSSWRGNNKFAARVIILLLQETKMRSPIARIVRNRLRPDQIMALVRHRYGSADRFDGDVLPYAQVAQVSGVAATTVRNNILRFHRDGNKAIRKKQPGRKSRIPEDI